MLPWLIAGLGVIAFVVALLDIIDVTPRVTTFDEVDTLIAHGDSPLAIHAGWGLYLCAAGAIAIVIGAVLLGTRRFA